MEEPNDKIKQPHTRGKNKELRGRGDVILTSKEVWELEKIIPIEILLEETVRIEEKLRSQKVKEGYEDTVDDLTSKNAKEVDFAHILEHAVLGVIDSNLPAHQLSLGATRNKGINAEKSILPEYDPKIPGTKIAHGREIHFSLAPTIPDHLQQEYVSSVIEQIRLQVAESGTLNLDDIKL